MSKDKIVRASDNNPIKRFVKKHFGTTYLQEMTDKELQAVADKPDSVFGKLKRLGQVAGERDRRLINLDKSYKDKVIRDHSKMLKELERRKKPRKVSGKKDGGLASAINRVKREQGVQGMNKGGLSGGNPSGAPKRMVPDPAISVVNPGKNVDVTLMAKGGYMDEEVEKMMMGGYMAYKDDK